MCDFCGCSLSFVALFLFFIKQGLNRGGCINRGICIDASVKMLRMNISYTIELHFLCYKCFFLGR